MPHVLFIQAALSFVSFAGVKVAGNSLLSQVFAGLIAADVTLLPKLSDPKICSYCNMKPD